MGVAQYPMPDPIKHQGRVARVEQYRTIDVNHLYKGGYFTLDGIRKSLTLEWNGGPIATVQILAERDRLSLGLVRNQPLRFGVCVGRIV